MTIAQLIECVLSKSCAINGKFADGTPFTDVTVGDIVKDLEKTGHNKYGYEQMYDGFTGQPIKAKIFMGPTFYQRLKHMVIDKMHCLSMDHEVLTKEGWKYFKNITMNDKIASLKAHELVYEKPKKLLHYPHYNGKMYHIKNQQLDLLTTPNHRMLVSKLYGRKQIWQEHELSEAKEIFGKHRKYKKNAEWKKSDYQFILPQFTDGNNITYPAKTLDMEAWLTFFGIWIAEGWTSECKDHRWKNTYQRRVTICYIKQRVKNVLYDAITKMGYNYSEETNKEKVHIHNRQLYDYMSVLSLGAPHKYLPNWVWKLSQNQARKLIESMVLGDGTYSKSGFVIYYTSSVQLADDFQKLCLHAGWSANISLHHPAGNVVHSEKLNQDIKSNYDLWRLAIIKSKNTPSVNHGHNKKQNIQTEEFVDYDGSVFCLEMPSETFYVRRNGKPVWTGNSRARGPYQQLTRQAVEGEIILGTCQVIKLKINIFRMNIYYINSHMP